MSTMVIEPLQVAPGPGFAQPGDPGVRVDPDEEVVVYRKGFDAGYLHWTIMTRGLGTGPDEQGRLCRPGAYNTLKPKFYLGNLQAVAPPR